MKEKLGQRGLYSGLISGSGYVYIPNDIDDRNKFISNCHNTQTISFLTVEGQRFDNVPVSKTIFSDLEFPQEIGDVGSLLFWVKHQKHNLPIVLAILSKKGETLGFQQYEFLINKQTDDGLVRVFGDGKKGNLFIKLNGTEGSLSLTSKQVKALISEYLNIETLDVEIKALNSFVIRIKNDLDTSVLESVITVEKDSFKYENDKGTFEIDANGKFNFTNDQYSLKDLMTDLISEIEAIKTSTNIGLQPPTNVLNFTNLRTTSLPKIFK